MLICNKCGAENSEDSVFCQNCGAKLGEPKNQADPAEANQANGQPNQSQSNQAKDQPLPFGNQGQSQPNQSQPNQAMDQPLPFGNQGQSQPNQSQSNQGQSQPLPFGNQGQSQPSGTGVKLPKNKKPYIIGACVAALAFVCLLLFLFLPRTINLNKYVKVNTQGYDGYGTASVELDTDKLEKDFAGKIKLTSDGKSEIKKYQGVMDLADLFDSSSKIKGNQEEKLALALVEEYLYSDTPVKLSKTEALSNGQSVRCKFSKKLDSKELGKYCRVRLKFKDFDYKVSGLKKVTKKDLKLDLSFQGMNGEGYLDWDSLPQEVSYFDVYSEDKLSNGDEVTLTLKKGMESDFIRNYGYLPKQKKYTVKVTGLESYLEKLSDLKDDRLADLQKQAQDEITASYARFSDVSVSDVKYAGMYLLTNKNPDDYWNSHNYLFVVCSATVNSLDGSFNPTPVYIPVRFSGVTDGSEVPSGDLYGQSHIDTADGWGAYITGYTDGTVMYRELISQNVDDWNHEVSDGLKGFGE